MLVLLPEDLVEFEKDDSLFKDWLKLFSATNSQVAVLWLDFTNDLSSENRINPSYSESYIETQVRNHCPHAVITRVVIPNTLLKDPLHLRENIALKMILNAHSTAVMAKLGRVFGNSMVNVRPGNRKLLGRATHLIQKHVNEYLPENISYEEANAVLFSAIEYTHAKRNDDVKFAEVPLAIVRILESVCERNVIAWQKAAELLAEHGLAGYLEALDRSGASPK